jgi:hypothetical protein
MPFTKPINKPMTKTMKKKEIKKIETVEAYQVHKLIIINSIIDLLEQGYDIRLSSRSIGIIEHFKSESRDKNITQEPVGMFGLDYFKGGYLTITADKFREFIRELK